MERSHWLCSIMTHKLLDDLCRFLKTQLRVITGAQKKTIQLLKQAPFAFEEGHLKYFHKANSDRNVKVESNGEVLLIHFEAHVLISSHLIIPSLSYFLALKYAEVTRLKVCFIISI